MIFNAQCNKDINIYYSKNYLYIMLAHLSLRNIVIFFVQEKQMSKKNKNSYSGIIIQG